MSDTIDLPVTKLNRTLAITATPTLIWQNSSSVGASLTYAETGSSPNMPAIVNPGTGEINFRNTPSNNNYTALTIITLTLDPSQLRNQNGTQPFPGGGRWALNTEGYYQSPPTVPPTSGAVWFCATPAPGQPKDATPVTVPYASCRRISDTQVEISINSDGVLRGTNFKFQFCLGLVLPGMGNYYITIDPPIKGTGTGGTSPLAEEACEADD